MLIGFSHFIVVSSGVFIPPLILLLLFRLFSFQELSLPSLFLSGTPLLCCSTASATDLREFFLLSHVFYLTLLPDIWHNLLFYQGFPGASSSTLKVVAGCPTEVQNRPGPSVCSITQCSAKCNSQ